MPEVSSIGDEVVWCIYLWFKLWFQDEYLTLVCFCDVINIYSLRILILLLA